MLRTIYIMINWIIDVIGEISEIEIQLIIILILIDHGNKGGNNVYSEVAISTIW